MLDDRLRVPVDDAYLHAIGLAAICFNRLEWNAVWGCEASEKTAGAITSDLVRLASSHANVEIARSLGEAAAEFRRLVRLRNDLLHANPGTAVGGEQRLFRKGVEWRIPLVNDLSDHFVAAGLPLNHYPRYVL